MIVGPKEVLGDVKAPTVAAEETKSARVVVVFFRVIMLLWCNYEGPIRTHAREEHLGCTAASWVDLALLCCLFDALSCYVSPPPQKLVPVPTFILTRPKSIFSRRNSYSMNLKKDSASSINPTIRQALAAKERLN
eukprot:scaffold486_cov148-Skeletonema_dohrnii-CCMP3373.AAC.9